MYINYNCSSSSIRKPFEELCVLVTRLGTIYQINLKVFMKRNFVQQFFYCIGKISLINNLTSLVEFL